MTQTEIEKELARAKGRKRYLSKELKELEEEIDRYYLEQKKTDLEKWNARSGREARREALEKRPEKDLWRATPTAWVLTDERVQMFLLRRRKNNSNVPSSEMIAHYMCDPMRRYTLYGRRTLSKGTSDEQFERWRKRG